MISRVRKTCDSCVVQQVAVGLQVVEVTDSVVSQLVIITVSVSDGSQSLYTLTSIIMTQLIYIAGREASLSTSVM